MRRLFMGFFNLRDDKGWGDGELTYPAIPLGLLGLLWWDLYDKAWNQTLHMSGYQV